METVTLKASSPVTQLPGLDAAIAKLTLIDELYTKLEGRKTIKIGGLDVGPMKGMSDYARMTVESLEKLGEHDFGRQLRGARTFAEELKLLDAQARRLEGKLAGAPGGAVRSANPAVAKKVAELETALASVNLRRNEIHQTVPGDVASQAAFDREAASVRSAEQGIATAANASTAALEAQGQAVLTKTGQMGQLSGAVRGTAAAERELVGATGQNAQLSERYVTTAEGRVLAEQKFRTAVGQTQRVMGASGETIIENTNFLERHASAFRRLDSEFANRKSNFGVGSPEHIALLRQEAAATEDRLNAMKSGGFQEEAIFQQRVRRQALLESQANRLAAKQVQLPADLRSLVEFETRRADFGAGAKTDTRRQTLPGGGYAETTTLRRDAAGMREQVSLMARYDAQGRALSASMTESNRTLEASGRTTQNSLLGTVGMAAKFIAVYRGIDLGVRALEAGATASIEFERKLATLQIIYHGTVAEARELGKAVLEQAAALGQDGVAALDVATDFARFGLNQREVLEATRVAMVAANVAQLDLAQSGKYLQAIYSGYQLNIGQLAGVLGSLDTVSHNYNVTNTQLLDGLSRVAPLAKQAGVSLNELIGYEAVITGRTARPGSEAGNALKALISRLAKAPVQATLQDIAGVSVTDEAGGLKTASQVINELFIAYQNLGRAEQQELLIKVAGTQQASRIAALLDGYLKSQRLAIDASRDLGRAERENIAVRATLSSQLGTLSTQWQRFWVASAGAGAAGGLQRELTDRVELLSQMLGALTSIENVSSKVTAKLPGTGAGRPGRTGSGPQSAIEGVNRGLISMIKDITSGKPPGITVSQELWKGAPGYVEKLADKLGLGDYFKTETDKSTEALIKFNAEVDKLEKGGEGTQATSRLLRTVDRLMDTASPETLQKMIKEAAHAVAPLGDVKAEEDIRGQLSALAEEGDYLALHARLRQMAVEADRKDKGIVEDINQRLDRRIVAETKALGILNQRQQAASKSGNRDEADRLDREIDEKENALIQLRAKRSRSSMNLFPEGEEAYGFDPDAAARRSSNLEAHFKGIEELSHGYASLTARKVEEIDGKIEEINAKEELLNQRQQSSTLKGREAGLARDEYREAMQTLEAEKERLGVMREYAGLQDRITEGSRLGRIQIEAYKTGRNETETLLNQTRGITGVLLPNANRRFDLAGQKGDLGAQAEAQAEALQLGNQLEGTRLSLEERRFRIAADIVNERRKENEEATKSLLLGGREDQLRGALIAKFLQQRGGRGFSNAEFQFLDQQTKEAITKFNPTSGPPGLRSPLRDLEAEQRLLLRNLSGVTGALKAAIEEIADGIGRKLIVAPPPAGTNPATGPGVFTPPPIQMQFSDQYRSMITSLEALVGARLDTVAAEIRAETRSFIQGQRLAGAQSVGAGAI